MVLLCFLCLFSYASFSSFFFVQISIYVCFCQFSSMHENSKEIELMWCYIFCHILQHGIIESFSPPFKCVFYSVHLIEKPFIILPSWLSLKFQFKFSAKFRQIVSFSLYYSKVYTPHSYDWQPHFVCTCVSSTKRFHFVSRFGINWSMMIKEKRLFISIHFFLLVFGSWIVS